MAVVIVIGGVMLFRDNMQYLLGRGPGKEVLDSIKAVALSVDGVLGVHDLRAEYVGPGTLHADFHIEVNAGASIVEANEIAGEVQSRLEKETDCSYCNVHVDHFRGQSEM